MPFRPAPANNKGLVLPPRALDCIGERCPVAKNEGRCFKDDHHLYWPYSQYYKDAVPLIRRFRSDRHNIKTMARCRHNSAFKKAQHSRYDGALMPPLDAILTHIDESDILAKQGVTATKMAGIVSKLMQLKESERAATTNESLDELHRHGEAYSENALLIVSFEILTPDDIRRDLQKMAGPLDEVVAAGFGSLVLRAS